MNSEKARAILSLVVAELVNVGTVALATWGTQPWQSVLVECAAVAIVTALTWWRNHNVSEAAQVGQELVDRLKAGQTTKQALTSMLAGLTGQYLDVHEGEE